MIESKRVPAIENNDDEGNMQLAGGVIMPPVEAAVRLSRVVGRL